MPTHEQEGEKINFWLAWQKRNKCWLDTNYSSGASGLLNCNVLNLDHLMGVDQWLKFKCPRAGYRVVISRVNSFSCRFSWIQMLPNSVLCFTTFKLSWARGIWEISSYFQGLKICNASSCLVLKNFHENLPGVQSVSFEVFHRESSKF